MDHYTRRIVGFGEHRGVVNGVALCRMFNQRRAARPRLRQHGPRPVVSVRPMAARICGFSRWKKSRPSVRAALGSLCRTVTAPFGANVWTPPNPGRAPIWRSSCSISNGTTTVTARMPFSVDARETRVPARAAYARTSVRIGGWCTVGDCIKHQLQRDPRVCAPCVSRTNWNSPLTVGPTIH